MKQLFLILALIGLCPFIQAKPLAVEESYYRYKDELGIQAKEQAIYSLKASTSFSEILATTLRQPSTTP